MTATTTSLDPQRSVLDRSYDYLRNGAPHRGMRELFTGLLDLKRTMSPESWREFATETAINHPLRKIIHRDPRTSRSFEKPRGYAGDAVLLDYIYQIATPEDRASVGHAVYDYATGRAAACAVRHRRALLAHAIDRAADRAEAGAHVLSVACGHLREATLSTAMRRGWVERFVGLDADAESLAVVEREWEGRIEPVQMSVARMLGRAKQLGSFDLTYSAGLYDYLEDGLAQRLTLCMFETLRPGGRLIISNFLPTVPDAGYMETYMGWELIYRNEAQVRQIADLLPADEVRETRVFSDPFGAIAYLEVERR